MASKQAKNSCCLGSFLEKVFFFWPPVDPVDAFPHLLVLGLSVQLAAANWALV